MRILKLLGAIILAIFWSPAYGRQDDAHFCETPMIGLDIPVGREVASRLPKQLKRGELDAYQEAFKEKRREKILTQIPAQERTEILLPNVPAATKEACPKLGYAQKGASLEATKGFLLARLNRPLIYLSPTDTLISRGSDGLEAQCAIQLMAKHPELHDPNGEFLDRLLKLPNLSSAFLNTLQSNLSVSKATFPFHLKALRVPAMNSAIASGLLTMLQRSELGSQERRAFAEALLDSKAFREEPAIFTTGLLDDKFAGTDSALHAELLDRLARQNPPPIEPVYFAGQIKAEYSLDFDSLYRSLSADVKGAEKAELLDHFLYRLPQFGLGREEIAGLLKDSSVGPPRYFSLALAEAKKPKYLSSSMIEGILNAELDRGQLDAGQLTAITDLSGRPRLSRKIRVELFRKAAPQIAHDLMHSRQALSAGFNLIEENGEREEVVWAGVEKLAEPNLADAEVLDRYEQILGKLRSEPLQERARAKHLAVKKASAKFAVEAFELALKNSDEPNVPLAELAFAARPWNTEELELLSRNFTSMRKHRKKLEPLLRSFERQPHLNQETRDKIAQTRADEKDAWKSNPLFQDLLN